MITVEILNTDLETITIPLDDYKSLDEALSQKVLGMRLLSDGKTLTIEHSNSHYFLVHNTDNERNTVFLDSYDTYEGKEFNVGNPFSTDQYRKPFYPSWAVPYRTPFHYWIFEGSLASATTWKKAKQIIDGWI